jgi:hypothetical protein
LRPDIAEALLNSVGARPFRIARGWRRFCFIFLSMRTFLRCYEEDQPNASLQEQEEFVLRDGSVLCWEWDLDAKCVVLDDEPLPVARLKAGDSCLLRTEAGVYRLTSHNGLLEVKKD